MAETFSVWAIGMVVAQFGLLETPADAPDNVVNNDRGAIVDCRRSLRERNEYNGSYGAPGQFDYDLRPTTYDLRPTAYSLPPNSPHTCNLLLASKGPLKQFAGTWCFTLPQQPDAEYSGSDINAKNGCHDQQGDRN